MTEVLDEEATGVVDLAGDGSIRAELQRVMPDLTPLVSAKIEECLNAKKRVRVEGSCPNADCGCQHSRYVEINDARLGLEAARMLADYTQGKPGVAGADGIGGLSIVRFVQHGDVDLVELLRLLDEENYGSARDLVAATIRVEESAPPAPVETNGDGG